MTVLHRNIKSHAEAGPAVFHPAANGGFVNVADVDYSREDASCLPGTDEVFGHTTNSVGMRRGKGAAFSPFGITVRHPETQRHSGPKRKRNQQDPQTIAEWWDQQDDGWW